MPLHKHADPDRNNAIFYGDSIAISANIDGRDNAVKIGNGRQGNNYNSTLTIDIHGDKNRIIIANDYVIRGLHISIGNDKFPVNNVVVSIGKSFTSREGCIFHLYLPAVKLLIGSECMFSSDILIRCGELPHLIFDNITGEYLDTTEGISIGNHVWVGTKVYIGKKVNIPDGCIVGATSTVTRIFSKANCVIAGNPATVMRENIRWYASQDQIDDSIYAENLEKFLRVSMNK